MNLPPILILAVVIIVAALLAQFGKSVYRRKVHDFVPGNTWRILFWLAQVLPPTLMFLFIFGDFGIGSSMVAGPPFLFSILSFLWLLWKKKYTCLLRPALTIVYVFVWARMGGHYAATSVEYVKKLASVMQEQCSRDGYCKVPEGEWRADGPTLFTSHTKGLVPMRLILEFDEVEPDKTPSVNRPCTGSRPLVQNDPVTGEPRFTTFCLIRGLEDHNFHIYGGVGRPLNIQNSDRGQL